MKIQFLGTAAAEGFPALYCMCPTCQEALLKKGKNIRSRCQALIDDKLLIDFGPDTYYHMIQFSVPTEKIHHVIVTHDHSDHFYSNELCFRRKGFAAKVEDEPLYVYGTKPIYEKTLNVINEESMPEYLQAVLVTPFKTFKVMDYQITPLKANHDRRIDPVIYLINKDDKTLLYAHDTGYFLDETWQYLKSNVKKPLDLLSLDCTAGILKGWRDGHLSFDTFLEVIDRLKKENIVDSHTIIIANHFSHNGHATYDTMLEEASKYNVDVSYDGKVINF